MEMEQTASADSATVADTSATQAELTTAAPLGTTQVDPAAPENDLSGLAELLPADDGMEEIEHEGIKAKVPKELKEAFLRQQDYTRKTQEVAEQRRQFEAQQAAFQQQTAFHREHIAQVAGIVAIDNQLTEYQKLDWPKLIAENPQQAHALDMQMRGLQGRRAQLAQELTHKEQQQALNQQQATARRIQESQRELEREIKGWSPELGSKLVEYAKKSGLPAEAVSVTTPPWLVKLVHKASQLDQLIAQRTTKPAATPAAPPSRVGAKASTAVTDPDKLSPDEWKKWRETQIDAKRKKR